MPRGALIALEGLDRSGKSTQAGLLVSHLESVGHKVLHLRFPDRTTPVGHQINTYLTDPESHLPDQAIHLLFSANRWEHAQTIRSAIQAGTTVVMDRYYYSGIVYSAAKAVEGMDLEWCRQPEVGLPRPDLCLYFYLSEEEQEKRAGFGGERYEKREMQGKVRALFEKLRNFQAEKVDMTLVHAGQEVQVVQGKVQKKVDSLLETLAQEEGSPSAGLRTVEKS